MEIKTAQYQLLIMFLISLDGSIPMINRNPLPVAVPSTRLKISTNLVPKIRLIKREKNDKT